MGTSWQSPGSQVMLQGLWCLHTWLRGVGPGATWGCSGPGDEGQLSTADAPGKTSTYLRVGSGPCPELLSLITTPPAQPGGTKAIGNH